MPHGLAACKRRPASGRYFARRPHLRAQIAATTLTSDVTQPGTTHTSTYYYDGAGHLTDVRIQDGQPRTVELVNNAQGEVIKRDVVYDSGIAAPHELHYYVDGMAVGLPLAGARGVRHDLPLTFHPVAIRASAVDTPSGAG